MLGLTTNATVTAIDMTEFAFITMERLFTVTFEFVRDQRRAFSTVQACTICAFGDLLIASIATIAGCTGTSRYADIRHLD